MQRQTQVKGEMTGRAMGRHLINLYSNGVSKVLKIDDIEQLRRDIDEDPDHKGLYGRYWCFDGNYLWEVVVTSLSCLSHSKPCRRFIAVGKSSQARKRDSGIQVS